MSKILRNNTDSDVVLTDTGVTIAGFSEYMIPPQDYLIFAASSDVISKLSSGDLTLNDGSFDITNLSDAVSIIKGFAPEPPDDAKTGSIVQLAGVVGAGDLFLPDPPVGIIKTAFIRCSSSDLSKSLQYSFDGGLAYGTLGAGEFIGWPMRGNKNQIIIRGSVDDVAYECIFNILT